MNDAISTARIIELFERKEGGVGGGEEGGKRLDRYLTPRCEGRLRSKWRREGTTKEFEGGSVKRVSDN